MHVIEQYSVLIKQLIVNLRIKKVLETDLI
jgi:hypothetical protein